MTKNEIKKIIEIAGLTTEEIKSLAAELIADCVEETEVGNMVKVAFPSVNKNDWLSDNDEEIEKSNNIENVKIMKVVELSYNEYKEIGNSLLENREEMFEKIGGCHVDDDSLFEGVKDYSDEWRTIIREHGYSPVVKVTNGKDSFFVNTEGYGYARYVGREVA